MSEVERYLKRATRGLPRRQRVEIRAELESHLFERVRALQAQGLTPEGAVTRVLGELGPADTANRALRRVHYVHPALNVVVAFGVLAVAWMGWQWRMISVFPISDTNMPSIFTNPLYPPRTVSSGDFESQQGYLLSFSQAAAIFRGTPVQIIGNDESAQLIFPGHSSLDLGTAVWRKIEGAKLPKRYGFYIAPPSFVSFDDLMRLVLNSKWPLKLDITNTAAKLSVAGHPLNWPPEITSINAYPFIESWNQQVSALLHQEVMESGFIDWNPLFETKGHKVPLIVHDLIPREIYALAIKRRASQAFPTSTGLLLSSYMTHADASGTSKFLNFSANDRARIKSFRFVDSVEAWEKAPKNTALLLKLDPTFKRPPEIIPKTGILTAK